MPERVWNHQKVDSKSPRFSVKFGPTEFLAHLISEDTDAFPSATKLLNFHLDCCRRCCTYAPFIQRKAPLTRRTVSYVQIHAEPSLRLGRWSQSLRDPASADFPLERRLMRPEYCGSQVVSAEDARTSCDVVCGKKEVL
jgi:hypothetical protein